MTSPLTPMRRTELRAQAHKLNPLVIIGDKGLTDEVVAEIDRTLKAHELIKVRAATDDRKAREEWMSQICERLQAHPVQSIGKVLVIYRENFDKPREKKPQAEGREAGRKAGAPIGMGRRKVSRESRIESVERKTGRETKVEGVGRRSRGTKPKLPLTSPISTPASTATHNARRRSRTPSPLPESGPRRRRPRTSR